MNRKFTLQQPFLARYAKEYQTLCVEQDGISNFYEFTKLDTSTADIYAVPDGAVDLLFHIRANRVHSVIGGTVLQRKCWPMDRDCVHFGVRFQPGECILPDGLSIQDIVNDDLDIDADCFGDGLAEALAENHTMQQRTQTFSRFFQKLRSTQQTAPENVLEHYIRRRIYETYGTISVGILAEETGYSACYLRRVFHRLHGISPKLFENFIRFQNVLYQMQNREQSLGEIAQKCGYFDQSHMDKEFKKFSGITPEQYHQLTLEELKNESDRSF